MKNLNFPNSKKLYLTSDQMYNTFVRRDSLVCNMSPERVHVKFFRERLCLGMLHCYMLLGTELLYDSVFPSIQPSVRLSVRPSIRTYVDFSSG